METFRVSIIQFLVILNSLLIFLPVGSASASQIVENFSTSTYSDKANSTGVWNTSLKMIHPQMAVSTTTAIYSEFSPITDVGDGSDGSFDVSTYANFSIGGSTAGNTIIIDTSVHPVLKFTSFNLAPGWVIKGQGANPLWFKVLGTFTNSGTIDCSGGNGSGTTPTTANSPSGGSGKCGGGNGGAGGYVGSTAVTGVSGCSLANGACTVAGGAGGGQAVNNAGGGGGGGGYYSNLAGTNGAGTGPGAGGTSLLDPYITAFSNLIGGPGGGSGGGGGGYSTTVGASSGAGGGAGGGVIRITCVGDFTNTGYILANGGNGGSESGADTSGSGGGGAGGAIWIQTMGNFSATGPVHSINALNGTGGTIVSGTGTGGAGANGRTWLLQGEVFTETNSEVPIANLGDNGQPLFSELVYTVQSLAYDVKNTNPTYNSFIMNVNLPGTSTATLLVAGSSDSFVNDDTGFVAATNVSALQGKRYFRFKISFRYLPAAFAAPPLPVPLEIFSLTANFDGKSQSNFTFQPSCGTLDGPGEFSLVLSLCFMITQLFKLMFKFKNRSPMKA